MSQYVESRTKTFTAGAAIAAWTLVKLSSGKLAVAGLTDEFLGVLAVPALADGDVCPVHLRNAEGTIKCIAAGSVAQGAGVYGRANGKVDDVSTSGAIRVGIALEAAAADGDIIEVMPCAL